MLKHTQKFDQSCLNQYTKILGPYTKSVRRREYVYKTSLGD